MPRSQKGFALLIIIIVIVIISSLIVGGSLIAKNTLLKQTSQPPIQEAKPSPQNKVINQEIKQKNIIVVRFDNKLEATGNAESKAYFYSYNFSKEKRELFQLNTSSSLLPEAGVSPDGKKIYYINIPDQSNLVLETELQRSEYHYEDYLPKLWIYENNGTRKEYRFGNIPVSPIRLDTRSKKYCYWSDDSSKLACLVFGSTEDEAKYRFKIVLLDYNSGNISDVFSSDQIAPPKNSGGWVEFLGWDDNRLLLRSWNNPPAEINYSQDYVFDITSKKLSKSTGNEDLEIAKRMAKYNSIFDNKKFSIKYWDYTTPFPSLYDEQTKEEIDLGGIFVGTGFF